MRSKLLIVLVMLFTLCGCKPKEETVTMNTLTETNTGEYTYVIPFVSTDTRNYHSTYQSRYDIIEIGSGMEEYSKEYFPVKEYYAQEGQIITRTVLSSLVGRESEDNPQGLNPAKGSSFATGSNEQSVVDAVIVTDVFELDFTKKNNTSFSTDALTIAITVNQNQRETVNGTERSYTITADRLWEYASNAGRKLESYLRTLESVKDIPILILIYNTASSDATLPGGFAGYGYFTGRTGQFTQITEKWVLIPTTEANNLDSTTYNQFLTMKSALKEYLPENITIIGEAQYRNNEITYLRITVGVQTKTYAEVRSLTQYCAQLSRGFTESGMRLLIHIKSNDETFALIERKVNEDTPEITYLH